MDRVKSVVGLTGICDHCGNLRQCVSHALLRWHARYGGVEGSRYNKFLCHPCYEEWRPQWL